MEITESRRLYQQLAAELKSRIEQGVYLVAISYPQSGLSLTKKA
ncbi:Hexuronate utilization operon transcriptional repressor ExuR [Klebsiella grimontii]|uniref:Hexuronate utilization operon transcriptional repressor ExuR n=1 Tax=Klebsiella grimontii TaxID=2058152 RepID=A0A7H4NW84_9ENTR|nr:Hexuronate utilization operon transcriptional repressor ExuR [Klebsiella grimontii]